MSIGETILDSSNNTEQDSPVATSTFGDTSLFTKLMAESQVNKKEHREMMDAKSPPQVE